MPEVRRIAKHRHVPRIIKKAAEAERVQRDKERRKVGSCRVFLTIGWLRSLWHGLDFLLCSVVVKFMPCLACYALYPDCCLADVVGVACL